jgi:hypothetical protein
MVVNGESVSWAGWIALIQVVWAGEMGMGLSMVFYQIRALTLKDDQALSD